MRFFNDDECWIVLDEVSEHFLKSVKDRNVEEVAWNLALIKIACESLKDWKFEEE